MCRGPPDPSTALLASGVVVAQPKMPLSPLVGFVPGSAKVGLLNRLKNSVRNSALYRSRTCHFLAIDISTLVNLGPRKMLRAALPFVPYAGGVRMPPSRR